jgi:hypothetical protein
MWPIIEAKAGWSGWPRVADAVVYAYPDTLSFVTVLILWQSDVYKP